MIAVFVLSPSNKRRLSRDPQRVYKRARRSRSVLFPSRVPTERNCETKLRFGRWVALRERLTTLIIMGPIVFGDLVGYYRGCPRGDQPKLVVADTLLVVLGKGYAFG